MLPAHSVRSTPLSQILGACAGCREADRETALWGRIRGASAASEGIPKAGWMVPVGKEAVFPRGAPAGVCRARVSWNHLKLWAGPPGPAEWGRPEGGPALRPRPWPCAVRPSGRRQFSGNGARALMSVGFRAGPGAAGKGPGCVCSFSSVLVVSRGTPEGLAFGDGLIPSFPTPMYRSTRRVTWPQGCPRGSTHCPREALAHTSPGSEATPPARTPALSHPKATPGPFPGLPQQTAALSCLATRSPLDTPHPGLGSGPPEAQGTAGPRAQHGTDGVC